MGSRYKIEPQKWADGRIRLLFREYLTDKSAGSYEERQPSSLAIDFDGVVFRISQRDDKRRTPSLYDASLTGIDYAETERFSRDARRAIDSPPWLVHSLAALGTYASNPRINRAHEALREAAAALRGQDWRPVVYGIFDLVQNPGLGPRIPMTREEASAMEEVVELLRSLEFELGGVRDSAAMVRDPGETVLISPIRPRVSETWRENPRYKFDYLIGSSKKIAKSNEFQDRYANAIMYLAPATMAGGPNLCPCHTAGCFGEAGENCIAGTGRLEMATPTLIARSRLFFEKPEMFLERLIAEIEHYDRRAKEIGRKLALRLNGTSDVDWERRPGFMELFPMFPDVTFYDYTKVANRIVRDGRPVALPPNYHLTFSLSEDNDEAAKEVRDHTDVNIAVVFDVKPPKGDFPGGDLPKTFGGRPVFDGDKHDLRIYGHGLDPRRSIVGLRLKTRGEERRAQLVMTGFVMPGPQHTGRLPVIGQVRR